MVEWLIIIWFLQTAVTINWIFRLKKELLEKDAEIAIFRIHEEAQEEEK